MPDFLVQAQWHFTVGDLGQAQCPLSFTDPTASFEELLLLFTTVVSATKQFDRRAGTASCSVSPTDQTAAKQSKMGLFKLKVVEPR